MGNRSLILGALASWSPRSRCHGPGAAGLLALHEKISRFGNRRIIHRYASFDQGIDGLAGGEGIAFELLILRPAAIGVLPTHDLLHQRLLFRGRLAKPPPQDELQRRAFETLFGLGGSEKGQPFRLSRLARFAKVRSTRRSQAQ